MLVWEIVPDPTIEDDEDDEDDEDEAGLVEIEGGAGGDGGLVWGGVAVAVGNRDPLLPLMILETTMANRVDMSVPTKPSWNGIVE